MGNTSAKVPERPIQREEPVRRIPTPPPPDLRTEEQKVLEFYYDHVLEIHRRQNMLEMRNLLGVYEHIRKNITEREKRASSILGIDQKFKMGEFEISFDMKLNYNPSYCYNDADAGEVSKLTCIIEKIGSYTANSATIVDIRNHVTDLEKQVKDKAQTKKEILFSPAPAYKEDAPPAFDSFDATKKPSAPAE